MMPLVAEFLGTLMFLYAVVKYGTPLALGLAMAAATFLFNGQFNPAVTFMKFLTGSMSQMAALKFMAVQLLAAYVMVMYLRRY